MKKLLNWFLCHNVFIVILLFAAAAYYFRYDIFSVPAPADTDSVTPLTGQQSSEQPVVMTATEEVSETPAPMVEIVAAEPEAPAQAETDAEKEASAVSSVEVVQPSAEVAVEASAAIVNFPEEAKDTPEKILAEQDYQFRPPSDTDTETQIVEEDLLQKARQAYWNDQLDKATSLYRAYIEINPDNPDGYGELGNLLSTSGDLAEASLMYQKAAELLLQQGRTDQAAKLREVLDSIEIIQKSAN